MSDGHVIVELFVDAQPLAPGHPAPRGRPVRARFLVVGHVPDGDQIVAAERPVRARHPHHGRDLGHFDGRHRRLRTGAGPRYEHTAHRTSVHRVPSAQLCGARPAHRVPVRTGARHVVRGQLQAHRALERPTHAVADGLDVGPHAGEVRPGRHRARREFRRNSIGAPPAELRSASTPLRPDTRLRLRNKRLHAGGKIPLEKCSYPIQRNDFGNVAVTVRASSDRINNLEQNYSVVVDREIIIRP